MGCNPDNMLHVRSSVHRWNSAKYTDYARSILTGLPAGAYGTAGPEMARIWHVNEDRFPFITFGLVTWNMGAAIFPLVFVPLTETVGRMPGYFVSLIHSFAVWNLPAELSARYRTSSF